MIRPTIAAIFLAFGAASGPASAQPQPPSFPYDHVWVADSLGATKFAATSRPTFRMQRGGEVSGRTGCNNYMSRSAVLDGASLTIGPVAMTRMACFGAGGDNERLFAPAISAVTGWRVERRRLILETAKGPLTFRRR